MQSDEGGFTANTRIPFADLLSSFTGLLTLIDLDSASKVNIEAIHRYALSMQSAEGGFVGFALDQMTMLNLFLWSRHAALSLCR